MPSARPRITFDDQGVCNACGHAKKKQETTDWDSKQKELEVFCDQYRRDDGEFDCVVPCGGGKDGSTVSYRLQNELGMHPLCVTLNPQLPTEIGERNLRKFVLSGYSHLSITVNPKHEQIISKYGFTEQGRPRLPALLGQTTAVVNIAVKFGIPLIVYGEDGEAEYGGDSRMSKTADFSKEDRIELMFSKNDPTKVVRAAGLDPKDLPWLSFPSDEDLERVGITWIHFSFFEDWDPYKHYLIAKKHCGFQALPTRSPGTYSNFAQLDDHLQPLHTYLMYLKFGFGRASSDACIDVRRGALDRKQALALVRKYDSEYPEELLPIYLDYFNMTQEEFDDVLDQHVNKELFEKRDGRWSALFTPE
ncbi:MAG: N-acetyl sugar amidotransferase [Candidatus Lindowbacteria bacterium]|nr:N-acetyl sugar amidotransferase [Candidatus Lindowbacteria bacterium]